MPYTLTPAITDLADADWSALVAAVQAEQQRRDTIATAKAQTDDLAARYAAAQVDAAPIPWASVPDAIGPGVAVTWTDGNRWRNKSGAWLPRRPARPRIRSAGRRRPDYPPPPRGPRQPPTL